MSTEKKRNVNNFVQWLTKHRLIILLSILLIIIPIIVISSLYITTYVNNRPNVKKIFNDEEVQMKNSSYLKNRFELEFYVREYTAPSFNDEGVGSGGSLTFYFEAIRKENGLIPAGSGNTITVKVAAATYWSNYQSSVSSASTLKLDGTKLETNKISNFNEKWPKKPLWFVNIDNPNLFVYLEWKEKASAGSSASNLVTRKIVIEYNPGQYITNNTTFTPLS